MHHIVVHMARTATDDATDLSTEDEQYLYDLLDEQMRHHGYATAIKRAARMFIENDHTADASPDKTVRVTHSVAQDVLAAREDRLDELAAEVAEDN